MRSYFPDINVWIALAYRGHTHHNSAAEWFTQIDRENLYFCRFTQMGFLRLLTHRSVMQHEVRTQQEAWRIYDSLLADERVAFLPEPDNQNIEDGFRRLTTSRASSNRQWSDAYLAAFAMTADLTLVTFDRGLHQICSGGLLLE